MSSEIAQYSTITTFDLRIAYHQVLVHHKGEFLAFEAYRKLGQVRRSTFGVTSGEVHFQRIVNEITQEAKLTNTDNYVYGDSDGTR